MVVARNPDKNEANQQLDDAVGPMALQVTKNGGKRHYLFINYGDCQEIVCNRCGERTGFRVVVSFILLCNMEITGRSCAIAAGSAQDFVW